MAFVDDLGVELFTLTLVGMLSIYLTGMAYLEYRKNGPEKVEDSVRAGAFPLLILGLFMLIMGIQGEFVWALPGSYNILFYDPYTLLAIVVVAMSVAILLKQQLQYVGLMAFLSGIVAIYYGYQAYVDGLTSNPLGAFLLFLSFGIAGILTWPSTFVYDTMAKRKGTPLVWTLVLMLFWLALLVSAGLAAYSTTTALSAHLAKAP